MVRAERRERRATGSEEEEEGGGEREERREGGRLVDVAWGSFSRSRLPSPGTRSARIFLLASAEDQTSHFISDDPFNPYPSPITLVLPPFDPRSILLQPPLRSGFYHPTSSPYSSHVTQSYG